MPTSQVPSASVRSHSWLRAYCKSLGILLITAPSPDSYQRNQRLAMAHERHAHDPRRQRSPADLDLHRTAGCHGHAREPDGALERGRVGAARDLAFTHSGYQHALMTAQHGALVEHQSHELARGPACAYRFERLAADELALRRVEGDRPGQSGFQRTGVLVH